MKKINVLADFQRKERFEQTIKNQTPQDIISLCLEDADFFGYCLNKVYIFTRTQDEDEEEDRDEDKILPGLESVAQFFNTQRNELKKLNKVPIEQVQELFRKYVDQTFKYD